MKAMYKMSSNVVGRPRRDGSKVMTAHVLVPKEIFLLLQERGIDTFTIELTEEGILYRPVLNGTAETLPKWLEPK